MAGEIVAVSGQTLRNWDPETIKALFTRNFIILNGDAAYTLCDMGLGALAGIENARWMPQNGGEYAYEQVTDGERFRGRENARASAIISCSDALDVRYGSGSALHEYTAFFDSFRNRRSPGQTVVNGRVMIFPFGRFEEATSIPPMLYNSVRQAVLLSALASVRVPFPLVRDAAYLEPYCFEKDGRQYLYLVNAGLDAQNCVSLLWSGAPTPANVQVHRSDESAPRTVSCRARDGALEIDLSLPAMETALLRLS